MARPPYVELGQGRDLVRIPIVHEDRSVLAIDKPAGWLLVPFTWQKTERNLPAALTSSIAAGDFWARSRNLKFLRPVHRLDGDTTGILLLAKSLGAVNTYSDLFESRKVEKTYLAVVHGVPAQATWTCRARLGPVPGQPGQMRVDPEDGKEAETTFRVLETTGRCALVEARPFTGRTHQIRVHLLHTGHPVVGDTLYRPERGAKPAPTPPKSSGFGLGLRAVGLAYFDPFLRQAVRIRAPMEAFCTAFGFRPPPLDTVSGPKERRPPADGPSPAVEG